MPRAPLPPSRPSTRLADLADRPADLARPGGLADLARLVGLAIAASLAACSPRPTASEPARPAAPASAPAAPAAPASFSRIITEHVASPALGVDKDIMVYLPRGYDSQPATRWPVFYYLHGLGGNETNWVKHGHLDEVADRLGIAAIIVMPDGDDGFYIDSPARIDHDQCVKTGAGMFAPEHESHDTNCVRARSYETYLTKDVVGWVDATYRTLARRDGRAIAGLSMGGFGAMSLAMRHPDLFAAAASHSGAIALMYRGPRPFAPGKAQLLTDAASFGQAAGPIGGWIVSLFGTDLAAWKAHDVVELAGTPATRPLALYFDCGTEDDFALQDNAQYVHEALTAKRVEHELFLGPGKHDFAFWSARLPHSLAFLAAHTSKPQ